jgi:signal transduction histidine kinase
MWASSKIEAALNEAGPGLLDQWRIDALARLWHLDKELFIPGGPVAQCGSATIAAVTAGQESPGEDTGDNSAPAQCGRAWAKLPLAWADLPILVSQLTDRLRNVLQERGCDAATLAHFESVTGEIRLAMAEARIHSLEQQLAVHREESVLTEHLAGRFLANASHEIRTPLTAVLGFAELLLEDTYGSLNVEQRTAIGHIENSAQNLLEIVNNLLDLLHIRAGKLTLQYRPVNVGELLRNVYQILSPLAVRKNVAFELEMESEPGTIEADENIVRHIVYHLLASGIRATPAHGEVSLTAERSADTVTILTRDTALHIPPEALANMLDPFPRLENSPARGYEGWEVGLPLVRRYVALHGGELEMESLPQNGTIFRIILPISRSENGRGG